MKSQPFVQCNIHLRPDEKDRVQDIARRFDLSLRLLLINGAELIYRLNRKDQEASKGQVCNQ